MIKYKAAFFLLFFFCLPFILLAQRDDFRGDTIEVKKIALHIVPDLLQKKISGKADIYFSPKVNNVSSIRFDLLRMNISSLVCSPQNCSYTYNDTAIFIQFGSLLKKDSNYVLTVAYNGSPVQDASWGGWYWSGNYVYNLGVGFKSKPHTLGRAWFPCIDNFKVKQAFDITISCPNNLMAVSGGVLLSKVDTGGYSAYSYSLPQPVPCYLASFNVGPYVLWNDTLKSIDGRILQIRVAGENVHMNNIKSSMMRLKETVSYFENMFGPYPFDVVGYSFIPFNGGAMEHAANIGLPLFVADGALTYETLWAHELSHQWWGDNITCASPEEMWINEGWASYCEKLFIEHFYGKDAYRKAVDDNHRYCLQFAHLKDSGYYSLDNVPQAFTYGVHAYQKGSDMIHTLRMMSDDSSFIKSCRKLLTEKRFSSVTTDTVLKYFAKSICELNGLNELFKNPHYLSNKLENINVAGASSLNIKQATYTLKYPGNTCLPVSFSGRGPAPGFTLDFDSIHSDGIYATPGNTSSIVIFDDENKFSDANTSQTLSIGVTGSLNFDNEVCNVNITQKYDSGFIYINRSWDYTGGYFTTKGMQSNSKGFWTIDGHNLDKITGSIRFYYNGAPPSMYLGFESVDYGFITQSEDSLVLLFRQNYDAPWQIVTSASKIAGSLTDKKGSFVINTFQKGQYCIGQYKAASGNPHSVAEYQIQIMPNPASDIFTVIVPVDLTDASMEVLNLQAQVVFNQQLNEEKNKIDCSGFAKGIYFIRVKNSRYIICKKLIID